MREYRNTIRNWLTENGFNWEVGQIIVQTQPEIFKPIDTARLVDHSDSILDEEFSTTYGSPDADLFIASDDRAIYFADNYDGSQRLVVIEKNIMKYLDFENYSIPLPGGG